MLFDTHCHLNDEKLIDRVEEVIESAHQAGVTRFLVVGWDKQSSLAAIDIAERFEGVYAAVGYHPENIFDINEKDLLDTLNLSQHPKVVAIGEIGLDYHWSKEKEKRELQKQYFIKQIEYANKHKLPISIHNREAFEDCLKILKEHKPLYGGVMHCYSGSVELLNDVLELGLMIGLDGPLTFLNAKTPKEVCEVVPLDKLLLETDCPYLSPHPLRGTINEPKNLGLILDEVSRLKNISKKHVAEVTFENACKLFHV